MSKLPILHFELSKDETRTVYLRTLARERGWARIPSDRVPLLLRVDREDRYPSDEDLTLAADVLETIALLRQPRAEQDRDRSVCLAGGRRVTARWPASLLE